MASTGTVDPSLAAAARRPDRTRPVDWIRVAEWTAQLIAGDLDAIRRTFGAEGTVGPTVAWAPAVAQVPTRPLGFLAKFWAALPRDGGDLPHPAAIDAMALQ